MRASILLSILGLAPVLIPSIATAQDALTSFDARLERPTLHTLGVQLLVDGDDDRDATVSVRVREIGGAYRAAPPLYRVRVDHLPSTVASMVPDQLAGSVFDLRPDTAYELELQVLEPDGAVDETMVLEARTRAVPADPASPRAVPVSDADALRAALSGAAPGDVIELAAGTYVGPFTLSASGTEDAPIVIRGASTAGVVLDGDGCACNVLEVYGSHVHVERMTLRAAVRALRFLGDGTTGDVARRLRIEDVVHGIGSGTAQTDFLIADNDIEGRLAWPWTFAGDASSHWDDRGVDVNGDGHVICHNRIRGFGDPIVNKTRLSRGWDAYGNDVLDAYDGVELDEAAGNVRLFGNRWTNVMVPVSIQPIFGGPAYVLRNVAFNAPEEQIKLKSLGGTEEPSGVLIWHNTFVSPNRALNLQTPITQYDFRIENNLFVGPASPSGRAVEWTASIVDGVFDYDGYFPDDGYWLGTVDGTFRTFATLADARAAGVEENGVALSAPIFESGMLGPDDDGSTAREPAASFALDPGSNAIDVGRALPGINDGARGDGPDLGAWERECPTPTYGPRPEGDEEAHVARVDCAAAPPSGDDAGVPSIDGSVPGLDAAAPDDGGVVPGTDGGTSPADGGCGCRAARRSPSAIGALVALSALALRRRRR